jgi:diacylglycerol kinase (ATP)
MNYDKSLFGSVKYAFQGILHALKNNRNLRIAFFAAVLVIIFGLYFQVTTIEMIILLITILLVILTEMINTSIEEMVNLITTEHKIEAKIAKDVAAGMVLTAVIGSVILGIYVFAPYILRLFH